MFLVDVVTPRAIRVEQHEDGLVVSSLLSGPLYLCVAPLAERALKRQVVEDLMSTDRTPQELEQRFSMSRLMVYTTPPGSSGASFPAHE